MIFVIANGREPEAVETVSSRLGSKRVTISDLLKMRPDKEDVVVVVDDLEVIWQVRATPPRFLLIACMRKEEEFGKTRVAGANAVFDYHGRIAAYIEARPQLPMPART